MAEQALRDFLSEAEIEALYRPAGEALGLPGRAYGEDFYRLEQRELFPRLWCVAGFSSDIPELGDMMPVELAGWPLVLVRGEDGEVRAFHNICRHRAMRVVPAPCRGHSALVCPWHSWTYDLRGKLVATPKLGGERSGTAAGFDKSGLDLRPVAVGCWLDFVFVNIDGKAPPFEEHIEPLADLLASHDLSQLERGDSWALEYPGNWKVSVEGAVEDYHLPWGHPQIIQGARQNNPRLDYASRCFMSNSSRREYARESDAGAVMALEAGLPSIPFAGEASERRTHFIGVFPNGALQVMANHLMQGIFAPDGAENTKLSFHQYYMAGVATDPAYLAARAKLVEEWILVFEQDIPFVQNVHQNYKVRDRAGIDCRFSPYWEANVLAFQQSVVEALQGG